MEEQIAKDIELWVLIAAPALAAFLTATVIFAAKAYIEGIVSGHLFLTRTGLSSGDWLLITGNDGKKTPYRYLFSKPTFTTFEDMQTLELMPVPNSELNTLSTRLQKRDYLEKYDVGSRIRDHAGAHDSEAPGARVAAAAAGQDGQAEREDGAEAENLRD